MDKLGVKVGGESRVKGRNKLVNIAGNLFTNILI